MSGVHRRVLEAQLGCGLGTATADEWLDGACKLDSEARDHLAAGDTAEAQLAFQGSRVYFRAAELRADPEWWRK